MAFASFDRQRSAAPLAEINMVPLIDVMLVLLVIFIVTAPLLTHAVKLDLPQVSSQPDLPPPEFPLARIELPPPDEPPPPEIPPPAARNEYCWP